MRQTIQTPNLDRTSLLQHVNSADMSQDLDPSSFYLANDPRHHQPHLHMRPLFPRQHSLTTQTSNLSPSKSFETLSSTDDGQKPEKQYHYLPGNAPESPRSITLPNLIESQGHSNTLPSAIYPPYPPQPHPRTFTPMANRNNTSVPDAIGLGHTVLPFANSSNIVPGFTREPFEMKGQSFSSFLEDKQYETLEEKSKVEDGPPSIVNFPPSKKPNIPDEKIMNIGDDDTIVRHITVKKKKKNYHSKSLIILYQVILTLLLFCIAAIAVVALLEVKRLEGASGATTLATAPPTARIVPTNTTDLEARISNMNATIMALQAQISSLTSQLTSSNTSLSERVVEVEESGIQLNNQLRSLNYSLAQSANNTIGPCRHTQFTCTSVAGGLGCVPSNQNRPELMIQNGYQLSSIWCEGSLNDTAPGSTVNYLAHMNTYVKLFDDTTPNAYQCGCNLPIPAGFSGGELLFFCTTNIIQCRF